MLSPKMFFAHISYTSFQNWMSSGKMLHKKKFNVHTDFKKLEGTLVPVYFRKASAYFKELIVYFKVVWLYMFMQIHGSFGSVSVRPWQW